MSCANYRKIRTTQRKDETTKRSKCKLTELQDEQSVVQLNPQNSRIKPQNVLKVNKQSFPIKPKNVVKLNSKIKPQYAQRVNPQN